MPGRSIPGGLPDLERLPGGAVGDTTPGLPGRVSVENSAKIKKVPK
jgi:hypothetical protein